MEWRGIGPSGWVPEQPVLVRSVGRERARRALEAERERSERLLLNVLPGPIAERLKVSTGVIADHYDTVSVFDAAKRAGLEELSYCDLRTLSILGGTWERKEIILYGRKTESPSPRERAPGTE